MDKLGELLRSARDAWGLTGKDMGMKLYGQLNGAYYLEMERGPKCPNRRTVKRMSEILGLEYELLVKLLIQRHVKNLNEYYLKGGEYAGRGKGRKLSAEKSKNDGGG